MAICHISRESCFSDRVHVSYNAPAKVFRRNLFFFKCQDVLLQIFDAMIHIGIKKISQLTTRDHTSRIIFVYGLTTVWSGWASVLNHLLEHATSIILGSRCGKNSEKIRAKN